MFYLELTEQFSAAHALRDYPGVCARIHGHNWKVRIGLRATTLDDHGMTADYADLKKIVDDLIAEFDHNLFNDHPFFKTNNPTSENIARYIFDSLSQRFPQAVTMEYVQIWETDNFSVMYQP